MVEKIGPNRTLKVLQPFLTCIFLTNPSGGLLELKGLFFKPSMVEKAGSIELSRVEPPVSNHLI